MNCFKENVVNRRFLLLGGIFLLLALSVAGCSDSKVTNSPGTSNDPTFLTARGVVDSTLVPQALATFSEDIDNQNGFSPDSGGFAGFPRVAPGGLTSQASFWSLLRPSKAAGSIQSGYQNGWHYFIFDSAGTFDTSGTAGTVHFADSVQFQNNSGPQQYPDATTSSLQVILLLQAAFQNGFDSAAGQLYSNHALQRSGNTLTLNGTEKDSVWFSDGSNRALFRFGHAITNVKFTGIVQGDSTDFDDCPVSGTARFVGSIAASGPNVPNGSFFAALDVTITFQGNGQIKVVVVDSNRHLFWEYTRSNICQPGA
jgi:hypothetical protein